MIPTRAPLAPPWPATCEVGDDGPCATPADYTVAVEDTVDDGETAVVAVRQTCGFHLQDAVDEALDLGVPDDVADADRYLTDAERRITVGRYLPRPSESFCSLTLKRQGFQL